MTTAKKVNSTGKILVIFCAVLIAMGGVLIFLLLDQRQREIAESTPQIRETIGGRGVLVTPDNLNTLTDEVVEPIEDTRYTSSMSLDWVFDTWDTPAPNVYVRNDTANKRTVYFDFYLDDENGDLGEMVYSSPYIPVGGELRNFALQKEVPAGEYSATIVYHLVDEEYNEVSNISLGLSLTVNE